MFKLEKTLKFVNVDLKYLKKLHDVSSEVYYKESNYETKPYLGILLTTEGRKYVLPLTSAKEKHKFWKNADVDRFLIYEMVDKRGLGKNDVYVEQKDTDEVKHILSAIDLKKMIPVVDSVISYVDCSSSRRSDSRVTDFFFQMERKLFRDIKKPFKLEGITRIDKTPVYKAIREVLANCIANADFNFPRGIVILKDPDRIIIENPGSIITGKPQMLKGGISESRNKTMMKMFNLICVGERAGSGVTDIFSVWETEGWELPVVEEQFKPDRTIFPLAFIKQAEKASGKR